MEDGRGRGLGAKCVKRKEEWYLLFRDKRREFGVRLSKQFT